MDNEGLGKGWDGALKTDKAIRTRNSMVLFHQSGMLLQILCARGVGILGETLVLVKVFKQLNGVLVGILLERYWVMRVQGARVTIRSSVLGPWTLELHIVARFFLPFLEHTTTQALSVHQGLKYTKVSIAKMRRDPTTGMHLVDFASQVAAILLHLLVAQHTPQHGCQLFG